MSAAPDAPIPIRQTRERRGPSLLRKEEERNKIAHRVVDMVRKDIENHSRDRDWRMQRYAKLRQWSEGKSLPWEDASDVALPDMQIHSLSVQDALFNASVSTRPTVIAKPLSAKRERGDRVDSLLDTQFYLENPGEQFISSSISQFVNEGVCQAYIPWIRETRPVSDVHIFPPVPRGALPREYFVTKLQEFWPTSQKWNHFLTEDRDGWDWRIEHNDDAEEADKHVAFYTRKDKKVEMEIRTEVVVHDGPRPINLTYDEIITPVNAANLQAPSPSNPGGAAHVTMTRPITVDEIGRLQRNGFFDLITPEQVEELERTTENSDQKDTQQQKRTIQGQSEPSGQIDETHGKLTLLTCFDLFDLRGDGVNEDVIWWVIREKNLLLKAKRMTEMFPLTPPRRPFAEASFIEVEGFREGIGVPEILEGMHDLRKETLDLAMDAHTLETFKWGFYRATSQANPEVLRMNPGEFYPTSDPSRDFQIADMGQSNQAASLNIIALAGQWEEKLTLIGDVQQGRVPPGRSSALRTSGGIAQLMNAGASRPERILRRYFGFLTGVYRIMHELNRSLMPKAKEIRMLARGKNGEEQFEEITRQNLQGRFDFDFIANAGNSSRDALAGSLEQMMGVFVGPLPLQMGVVTPENVFQMFTDYANALGPGADRYLTPPSATSTSLRITAPEAIHQITNDLMPVGIPFEPPEQHLAFLQEFMQDEERMMLLSPPQQAALAEYAKRIAERVRQQQEQQKMQQAAEQFQQSIGGAGTPGPQAGPPGPPQQRLQENELSDETLPSAGGGGQGGSQQ